MLLCDAAPRELTLETARTCAGVINVEANVDAQRGVPFSCVGRMVVCR